MNNVYFYTGELGYFMMSLIPLLDLYISRYNEPINISTIITFKDLLNIYYKDSNIIKVVKSVDIISETRRCNNDRNMIPKNNKSLYDYLLNKLQINNQNKWSAGGYHEHSFNHKIKNKFIINNTDKKKYICIFPQNRKG